jgi:hypothetical protein
LLSKANVVVMSANNSEHFITPTKDVLYPVIGKYIGNTIARIIILMLYSDNFLILSDIII